MKKIIFFIFILFISNIFNSCSDELITIIDEYNPPYEIKAIPGDNLISINFWSGVVANDFVGFNLYIQQDSSSFSNALVGSDGGYPTVRVDTHTRSNFTLTFPASANIQNGNLYYVSVTAYGTNDLSEGGKIETKINDIIPVVPRTETTGATQVTDFTVNNNQTVTANGLKSYGYQTNFNSITVFTNNNTSSSAPYVQGGLYIFSNGGSLTKVWIISNGNYTHATHSRANDCNTI